MSGTKAILNDDGQLIVLAQIEIVFSNGQVLRGKRTGKHYSSNIRANLNRAFRNAILDCVYQILYDNNRLPNGTDGSPIGSGELVDDYSIDYKVLNYEINYLSDFKKRERYDYKIKTYKYGNTPHRYVVKYRDGKRYRDPRTGKLAVERYSTVSKKGLRDSDYLNEDVSSQRMEQLREMK